MPDQPKLEIEWVPTPTSSQCDVIGYIRAHMVLIVEFHSGAIWGYKNVPEWKWILFKAAPSKGQFLHYEIKKNPDLYPATKLWEPEPPKVEEISEQDLIDLLWLSIRMRIRE